MATLGERIKQLRGRLSQDELAKEVGLSKNTVYNYENGKRLPDADALIKLSDYFNVSVDYLLGRENLSRLTSVDDYKNTLNKYGPLGDELHESYMQLLNAGINVGKPAEVFEVIIKLKTCIRNLETAIATQTKDARESVKQYNIPLLKEIELDGSPAKESEKPSDMLYLLSFMSHGIDKAIVAKDELNSLLDMLLKGFSLDLLNLRFRLAYMKNDAEQEADNGEH